MLKPGPCRGGIISPSRSPRAAMFTDLWRWSLRFVFLAPSPACRDVDARAVPAGASSWGTRGSCGSFFLALFFAPWFIVLMFRESRPAGGSGPGSGAGCVLGVLVAANAARAWKACSCSSPSEICFLQDDEYCCGKRRSWPRFPRASDTGISRILEAMPTARNDLLWPICMAICP